MARFEGGSGVGERKDRRFAALAGVVLIGMFLAVPMGGTAMAAVKSAATPVGAAPAPYITNMTVHSYNGTPAPVGSGAPTSGVYDYSDISYRILNKGYPTQQLSIFGTDGTLGWTLLFRGPNGEALKAGTYNNAQEINYPPSSRPGLDGVFGPLADAGFDCGVENIGSFVIGNISMSDNELTSFSAYVEMNCDNSSGSSGYDIVRILYHSNAYLHNPDFYGYTAVTSAGSLGNIGEGSVWGPAPSNLNKPIVGIAHTADQLGYWMVASDGGIFAFGDAHYYGSTGNIRLNKPIVGMATTPDGKGYWLVASDGGIFSYGDAHYYGSTGNIRLNKPDCRHGSHTRRQGVLAGRLGRRDLRLWGRQISRIDWQHPPEQTCCRDGSHTRRQGLLDGRLGRRDLRLWRCPIPRIDGKTAARQADRGHGIDAGRRGLLAPRRRRRDLQLR